MMSKLHKIVVSSLWLLIISSEQLHAKEFPSLDHLVPQASAGEQTAAVKDLIQRLVPGREGEFMVKVNISLGPKFKDTFQLMTVDDKLLIVGSSGVAAASGFYYYLTQYCDCHISWAGVQNKIPMNLPSIPSPGIQVTSNDRFRYYQNVCTVSYSFVWWDLERWIAEIDWMAMSGINLPLAFNGQEAIWQRVYNKMGFTDEELEKHFGGPAFLAWARMGNMRGWGGPLPQSWHDQQVTLQHIILSRMRALGMIPVLPAFAGHVPESFTRLFPKSNVSKLGDWGHFNSTYCCTTLLDVDDPMFPVVGTAFIKEYTSEFGTDHIYNTDTFNEMTPKSSDVGYLKSAGKAVFQGMQAADPDAVWLMQGWLFLETGFWKPQQAEALLTSVPTGRMIILDLSSEASPQYTRLQSYYGQPFIWCMLHNFGGNNAMYGNTASVNTGPFEGRKLVNSTMIGTGLTPEGINQNDVMYEFMNENMWRQQPRNLTEWFSNYAVRRYGASNEHAQRAWLYLLKSAYNGTSGTTPIMTTRPKLGLKPGIPYDPEDVYRAWDNMQLAARDLSHSQLFRYDLVDVVKQSLQLISQKLYDDVIKAYASKSMKALEMSSMQLLELFSDVDTLLSTDRHFLMGQWIEQAQRWGTSDAERRLYEYNARNQVTLWGPTGEILDYARKQWAGLVKGYYFGRWELFLTELKSALAKKQDFNQSTFEKDVFVMVEKPFTLETNTIPPQPIGDQIQTSTDLFKKYRPLTVVHRTYFKNLPLSNSEQSNPARGHRVHSDNRGKL